MYDDIVDIYDQIFPLNQAFLRFLHSYLPDDGGRVLDLGCGPGDVVDLLTKSGYRSVGIDNSEGMIAAAKRKHHGTFYPYGFDDINRLEGPFDLIYCVGNSLSYLPNDQLDFFMKDVASLLDEGGIFLSQVVNWDRFLNKGQISFEEKPISGGRSFHRQYQEGIEGTVVFYTALKKGGQILGEWSDILYPKTRSLLKNTANNSGLSNPSFYGDYQKTPFHPEESAALIMAAYNCRG